MNSASLWLSALADPWSVGPCAALPSENAGAWSSLATGVEQLLRGETGTARVTFNDEYRFAASARDGERALLALILGWLADTRHFNFLPGGYGAASVDLELRWNQRDRLEECLKLVKDARTWPGARAAGLAYRWLQFIAARPLAVAAARDAAGHAQKDMLLAVQLGECESARDDARMLSSGAVGIVERSIAALYSAAGEPSLADEALARAMEMHRTEGDEAGIASCLALQGDWLIAPTSSALVRNLVVADAVFPTSELSWMEEAVEGASDGGDPQGARAVLEEARARYERADIPGGVATILLRLAYIAKIEGAFDRQIDLAKEAQAGFAATGDSLHARLAMAHCLLARLDARRFPEDRETAAAIGAWGNKTGSFSYALGLGLLFTRAGRQALLRDGDYEKAEACFQLALATNQALGAKCRESQTQADLAALHQALGNRQRSQTYLDDSIDTLFAVDTTARVDTGSAVEHRAALLTQQLYRDALDHRDAAGMERAVRRMSQLDGQAVGVAGFAVKSFLENTRTQASVLIPLYRGVDQRNAGNDGEAEKLFEEALGIAELKDKFLQALVQVTRRRYIEGAAAFEQYEQAGGAQGGLAGNLLRAMRGLNPSRAQQEALTARRYAVEEGFSFMVRAKAYNKAAAHLEELVQLAGSDWWSVDDRPWRPLSDIGEMQEGLGQYAEALATYEKAIETLEKRRSLLSRDELKTALAADFGVQYLYFQAVRAALRLAMAARDVEDRHRAEQRAFTLSEKGRARALLDLLAANLRRPAYLSAEPDDVGRWRQLTSSSQLWRGMLARARSSNQAGEFVQALRLKIEACEEELYQLQQKIELGDPATALKIGATAAQLISLDETAEQLAPRTAMLQYMTLGDELLVWAVTRGGMCHGSIRDMRAPVLTRLVREFQEGCARGVPLEILKEQARQLGSHLLDPLDPAIDKHERLIITPYGDLNLLPFAALSWRDDWLGKQRTLSYLPSASILLALSRPDSRAPNAMLAVGNPKEMAHQPPFGKLHNLPPLEYAESEARAVAKLYDVKPLLGPDATIDNVRSNLPTYRQLLFATHGVLYDEVPLLSGVALANGYVLTVEELMGLRLDVDLVTISACRSGLGARIGGEEIVGLTRGLLAAGARAAVVTLWPVFDLSTALLIKTFHELLKKPMDAPTALRLAQSWLSTLNAADLQLEKAKLRDLGSSIVTASLGPSHPQYWAPFVVIGG